MDEIPTDYPVIAVRVIPALFGGGSLFMIGMSSFMTVMTTEKQRTIRFGIFSIFITILGIIASPLSGLLFKFLNYIQFFSLTIAIYICGLIYVLVYIKERNDSCVSNQNSDGIERMQNTSKIDELKEKDKCVKKRGTLSEFFDPSLVIDSIKVIKRPRTGNKRKILLLAIFCQALFFATHGEEGLYILFARTALRWTTEFGIFVMYMTGMGLVGTTISTAFFVNILKLQDASLGNINSLYGAIYIYIFCTSRNHINNWELSIKTSGCI